MKTILCCALILGGTNLGAAQIAAPARNIQSPNVVKVKDVNALRTALREAKPGTRIEIAPGEYGNISGENVRGEKGKLIVLTALNPDDLPKFSALHLSKCAWLEVSNLIVADSTGNGLNIDDGGDYDVPSHHITLRALQVRDVGPKGNLDGIKMSGIQDFEVRDCTIERWADGGGGIDMVGCHRGVIENNIFRHNEATPENGLPTGATGIQAKGGCRDIRIEKNRFEHAGTRAINCGGSTGLEFFRPPLKTFPAGAPRYEAKDISIVRNVFIGSETAIAFVGVDGAKALHNTIYRPRKWAMRILQETTAPDFVPSRNVRFVGNLVAFSRENWTEGGVNIGTGTAPQTFTFARNFWFCLDDAKRSQPTLPTTEVLGIIGQNPLFADESAFDLSLQANSPAQQYGHTAKEMFVPAT